MESLAIDRIIFGELCEAVGDEFAFELVDTFIEETPGILAEMRAALATADADSYRRAAHSLKANGKTFGALEFADLVRAAELGGFSGDSGRDVAAVDAIEESYEAAAAALKALPRG